MYGTFPTPVWGVWDITVERTANDGVRLSGVNDIRRGDLASSRPKPAINAEVDVEQLPESALQGAIRVVAHRSLAYLRRHPAHATEMVSQMIMGEEGLALRRRDDWLQVQTGDGYVAWLHQGSCLLSDPGDPVEYRTRARRRSTTRRVVDRRRARVRWLRQSPDLEAPIVADLVQGAIVEAHADDNAPPADTPRWYPWVGSTPVQPFRSAT